MLSLLTFVVSVVGFAGLVYFTVKTFRVFQRREGIQWSIEKGWNCYSCKSDVVDNPTLEDYTDALDKKTKKYVLCTTCRRDQDIDRLTGRITAVVLNRMKLFLIKNNLAYIVLNFALCVTLITIGITTGIKILSPLVTLMNLLFSYVSYRRALMLTVEKDG